MLTSLLINNDPVALALADLAHRGICVEIWTGVRRPSPPDALPQPLLFVVGEDSDPPSSWGVLEDWIRLPSDRAEVHHRADRLIERAARQRTNQVYLDDDDLLHAGGRRTPLSCLEARLLRMLLAQPGRVVSRDVATDGLWGGREPADPRALDNRVKTLRWRLEGLPLQVHTVRGQGFFLECLTSPL